MAIRDTKARIGRHQRSRPTKRCLRYMLLIDRALQPRPDKAEFPVRRSGTVTILTAIIALTMYAAANAHELERGQQLSIDVSDRNVRLRAQTDWRSREVDVRACSGATVSRKERLHWGRTAGIRRARTERSLDMEVQVKSDTQRSPCTIIAPQRLDFNMRVTQGSARVQNFQGDVRVQVVGGTLTALNLTGKVHINLIVPTAPGLYAARLRGEVQIRIDRGNGTVYAVQGALDVRVTEGRLAVHRVRIAGDSNAEVDHGELTVNLAPGPQGADS